MDQEHAVRYNTNVYVLAWYESPSKRHVKQIKARYWSYLESHVLRHELLETGHDDPEFVVVLLFRVETIRTSLE